MTQVANNTTNANANANANSKQTNNLERLDKQTLTFNVNIARIKQNEKNPDKLDVVFHENVQNVYVDELGNEELREFKAVCMTPKQLAFQLTQSNPDLSYLADTQEDTLPKLIYFAYGASLTLEICICPAGSTYTNYATGEEVIRTHAYGQITFSNLILSENAQRRLDKVIDNILC